MPLRERPCRRSVALAGTTCLLLAVVAFVATASAQTLNPDFWIANGTVRAIVRDGNTVYVGGDFFDVGPATGGGALVNPQTGQPAFPFPHVFGSVHAVIPDSSGGWFIGGLFGAVDDVPCGNLAHVLADGSVSSLDVGTDGPVLGLAFRNHVLYVGGAFQNAGGLPRFGAAAVDVEAETLLTWSPLGPGWQVSAIAAQDSVAYLCGTYYVPYTLRAHVLAVDGVTGHQLWDTSIDNTGDCLAAHGDRLYVGGAFRMIGNQYHDAVAALDGRSGAPIAWDPGLSYYDCLYCDGPSVYSLLTTDSAVYIGGQFDAPSNNVAAVDTVSGALVPGWAGVAMPPGYGIVQSLALSAGALYVGADGGAVAFDPSTGTHRLWQSDTDRSVWSMATWGGALFAGGNFASLGVAYRSYLAAFDATSGAVTSWQPSAFSGAALTGPVYALAAGGGAVYAGEQTSIVAIDSVSAAERSLTRNDDIQGIRTLALDGPLLYVGGLFNTLDGYHRQNLAALRVASGTPSSLQPTPDGEVDALGIDGRTIYAGGRFGVIGGLARNGIAALDSATGVPSAWNPGSSGTVSALRVADGKVYVGGSFSTIGSASRQDLAAIDETTGLATPWNPSVGNSGSAPVVSAIAVGPGVVYVGGQFTSIGGAARTDLAAVDAASGAAEPWDPGLVPSAGEGVHAVAHSTGALYVGGGFSGVAGQPRANVAEFMLSDVVTPVLLTRFEARPVPAGVELNWEWGDVESIASTTLERADHADGPWLTLWSEAPRLGISGFVDSSAVTGRDYDYRITAHLRDGTRTSFPAIAYRAPMTGSGIALAIGPNPVAHRLRVDFLAQRVERARLVIMDATGRECALLLDGVVGPGARSISWDAGGSPAGIYFVVWDSPGTRLSRRFALL